MAQTCHSESDSDHSDHGEQREDKDVHTAEMIGPDGKKIMGPQQLYPQEAASQRAAARATQKPVSYTPSTTDISGTEGEDSVSEWYNEHPGEPKCGNLASSRLSTPTSTPVSLRASPQ
jgi:hypothetical protein